MSEIAMLVEDLSSAAAVYMGLVLVLAVGLLLFDRPKKPAVGRESQDRKRLAA